VVAVSLKKEKGVRPRLSEARETTTIFRRG